jgi:distribution and morphology protein 34
MTPGAPLFHPSRNFVNATPGPSSLRRMVTSRSDVFLSKPSRPHSESYANQVPASKSHRNNLNLSRQQTTNTHTGGGTASSTAARSSSRGTGTGTDPRTSTRSNTVSTLASSQLPFSKSASAAMSIKSMGHAPSKSASMGMGIGIAGAGTIGHASNNHGHHRASSFSMAGTSPGTSFPPRGTGTGLSSITLPLNNSVSQLATLSHSNHTLSPYARGHEHIAVRSFPHLGRSNTSASVPHGLSSLAGGSLSRSAIGHGPIEGQRGKGRRKRIYRIGKAAPGSGSGNTGDSTPLSPDLDDTPPRSDWNSQSQSQSQSQSSDDFSRRWSINSAPIGMGNLYSTLNGNRGVVGMDGKLHQLSSHGQQPSLTGLAQKVMRPNMARSPASRTSYGFPATSGR